MQPDLRPTPQSATPRLAEQEGREGAGSVRRLACPQLACVRIFVSILSKTDQLHKNQLMIEK
jgi:hypothetical protein